MPLFGPNVKKMKKNGDIEGLIKALDSRYNSKVREAAKEALVEIGEPVIPKLFSAMATLDTWEKRRVMDIFGKIGSAKAKEALIPLLDDEDAYVREEAVELLTPFKDDGLSANLVKLLKDPGWNVRKKAALALDQLSWEAANNQERIDYHIAGEQWDQLYPFGDQAVDPLIEAIELYQPLDGIMVLARIGGQKAIPVLIRMLGKEMERNIQFFSGVNTPLNIIVSSAVGLNIIGEPAVAPLIEELASDHLPTRVGASFVLKGMGEIAREPLVQALESDKSLIRDSAKELIRILDEGEET